VRGATAPIVTIIVTPPHSVTPPDNAGSQHRRSPGDERSAAAPELYSLATLKVPLTAEQHSLLSSLQMITLCSIRETFDA